MTGLAYALVPSPLGPLLLTGDDGVLTSLSLHGQRDLAVVEQVGRRDDGPFAAAAAQLDAYFAGRLQQFDLRLAPAGTPFQQAVWSALRDIPYGNTTSYGKLARRVGRPGAARAVGLANGSNPIAIIIPCHRVIGADGRLTGYGGGLGRKQHLLALERRHGARAPGRSGQLPLL